MNERQLAMEAREGNGEALAQLLYNNYEIVFRYLIKFTLNKTTAEDLAQETMVKAIEKINLYNPDKAQFSTWLISVAQNLYIDNIRKLKRDKKYVEEEVDPDTLIEHAVDRDDSMEEVLEAMGRLSEEVRVPIILKHYYGYSLEEIAAFMKIPLGTVKSRIHNGIGALRKELIA